MKVSNLGGAAAELPESAECFSAEAAGEALSKFGLLCATHQPLIRNSG